jgi:phosphate transport system permease protein
MFAGLSKGAAIVVLVMMCSLLIVLGKAAIPSVREFGLKFLVQSTWRPNVLNESVELIGPDGKVVLNDEGDPRYQRGLDGEILKRKIPPVFGALPVIYGTAVSSALALLFAVPLSLGAALFLIRISPKWLSGPVSFLIEFLAAIPSIAYGIWGVFVLQPFLLSHIEPAINRLAAAVPGLGWMYFEGPKGRDMLCAGVILAIMIVPIITAISRDVLKAVPRVQIEGTTALGASWWQTSAEMLRYSRSGLFGAVILGLARAAGETMAVTMVIGNSMQIHASLLAPSQTMASLLASQFDAPESAMHTSALMEVALILLVMSLAFNILARWLVVGSQSGPSRSRHFECSQSWSSGFGNRFGGWRHCCRRNRSVGSPMLAASRLPRSSSVCWRRSPGISFPLAGIRSRPRFSSRALSPKACQVTPAACCTASSALPSSS